MQVESIILSAGKGTRMKTEAPKVVQKLLGYEMVNHVLSNLQQAGIKDHTLVVGYKKEEVLNAIDNFNYDYVEQKQQLGTGHAVKVCKSKFRNKNGITVIVCGDTPLVSSDTFKKLITLGVKIVISSINAFFSSLFITCAVKNFITCSSKISLTNNKL